MDIDLHDEETFALDEQPDAFVLLSQEPIVFTVRGIKYFKPRFDHIGVDMATLTTADSFHAAFYEWCLVEYELLRVKIESEATKSQQASEHKVLLAAISGDAHALQKELARMSHKSRAGLRAVQTPDRTSETLTTHD